MTPKSSRYSGIIILFVSFFLALFISGIYYYFQIKQNENYQNQLHFRELGDFATALDNGIEQLAQLAKSKKAERDGKIKGIIAAKNKVFEFETQFETLLTELQTQYQLVDEVSVNFIRETGKNIKDALLHVSEEHKEQSKKLISLNKKVLTKEQEITTKELKILGLLENKAHVEKKQQDLLNETSQIVNELQKELYTYLPYETSLNCQEIIGYGPEKISTNQEPQDNSCTDEIEAFLKLKSADTYKNKKAYQDSKTEFWESLKPYKKAARKLISIKSKQQENITRILDLFESLYTWEQWQNYWECAEKEDKTKDNKGEQIEAGFCKYKGPGLKEGEHLSYVIDGANHESTSGMLLCGIELAPSKRIDCNEALQSIHLYVKSSKSEARIFGYFKMILNLFHKGQFGKNRNKLIEIYEQRNPEHLNILSKLRFILDLKGDYRGLLRSYENSLDAVFNQHMFLEKQIKDYNEDIKEQTGPFEKGKIELNNLLVEQALERESLKSLESNKFSLEQEKQGLKIEYNKANDELRYFYELVDTSLLKVESYFERAIAQGDKSGDQASDIRQNYIKYYQYKLLEKVGEHEIGLEKLHKRIFERAKEQLELTDSEFAINCESEGSKISANLVFTCLTEKNRFSFDIDVEGETKSPAYMELDEINRRFDELVDSTIFEENNLMEGTALESAGLIPNSSLGIHKSQFDKFESKATYIARDKHNYIKGEGWILAAPITRQFSVGASFDDMFLHDSERFPTVLIANKEGQVLSRLDNLKLNAFQTGIEFEHLRTVLSQLFSEQLGLPSNNKNQSTDKSILNDFINEGSVPGFSGYVDADIAGQTQRLFITPYSNLHLLESYPKNAKESFTEGDKLEQLFVVGIRSKSGITSEKLSISDSLVLITIIVFIIIVSALPLIKIRLISTQQAFSRSDRNLAIFSYFAIVAMSVIGYASLTFYNSLKDEKKDLSYTIFNKMKGEFNEELASIFQIAKDNSEALLKMQSSSNTKQERTITQDIGSLGFNLENVIRIPVEGSEKGKIYGKDSLWATKKMSQSPMRNLVEREYFKRAVNCDLWQLPEKLSSVLGSISTSSEDCNGRFFLQRIFNISDARTSTQFSLPVKKKKEAKFVFSFGTRIKTFLNAALPPNFGYLVFNNNSGSVLYHIENERSLIENVFVETDNNARVSSLVQEGYMVNEPVLFDTKYRGEDYVFAQGPLLDGVPLTLVVFYKKAELRSLNLLTGLTTIILVLLGFAVIALIWFLIPRKIKRELLWEDKLQSVHLSFKFPERKIWLPIAKLWNGILNFLFRDIRPVTAHTVRRWLPSTIIVSLLVFAVFVVTAQKYVSVYEDIENVRRGTIAQRSVLSLREYHSTILEQNNPNLSPSKTKCYFFHDTPQIDEIQMRSDIRAYSCEIGINEFSEYSTASKINNQQLLRNRGIYESIWDTFLSPIKLTVNFWLWKELFAQSQQRQQWKDRQGCSPQVTLLHINRFAINKAPTGTKGCKENTVEAPNIFLSAINNITEYSGIASMSLGLNNISLVKWICIILVIYVSFILFRNWILERLLGVNIVPHFRNRTSEHSTWKIPDANGRFIGIDDDRHLMIIRPSLEFEKSLFKLDKIIDTSDPKQESRYLLSSAPIPVGSLLADQPEAFNPEQIFMNAMQFQRCFGERLPSDLYDGVKGEFKPKLILVLSGLELVAMIKDKRQMLLSLFEYLLSINNLKLILLCEIAPLYIFTNPAAYPNSMENTEAPSEAEVIGWANIFKKISKSYDWIAGDKKHLKYPNRPLDVLLYEMKSWGDLNHVWKEFWSFHFYSDSEPVLASSQQKPKDDLRKRCQAFSEALEREVLLEDAGIRKEINKELRNKQWQADQIVDFYSANCGAIYRSKWELCTKAERILLYQMALGMEPNPNNREPLEHLLRRGFIFRNHGWHIINQSFRRFVLTAESPEDWESWLSEVKESRWRYLRIPLFAIVIAIVSILVYSATDALESAVGILGGILGLIPLAVRNFAMIRGSGSS